MLTKNELLYIEETARSLSQWTVEHRRNLHQIPETAWKESNTTAYLIREMQQLGYRIISGERATGNISGLVAEIGNEPHPLVCIRFDIDGLAVSEEQAPSHLPSREGFASTCQGNMHACGHDGHMAIGLTTARILAQKKDQLKGTIRFLFQPAEEGCMGAREMVTRGWLEKVDYFLAGHIVGREYGQTIPSPVDCITGVNGSLATSKINVIFHGRSCHGACPENGNSAITALCTAVLALNAIPRNSAGATRINIGRINGGEGRNIVAAQASMEMEVRGETTELNQYMEDQAMHVIQSAAAMYGCTATIQIQGKAPSLVTSEDFHQKINTLLNKLSSLRIATEGERFRASEDAALMMEEVKRQGGNAAFLLFPSDTTAPLHSRNYDFDETILSKAATVFSAVVLDLLLDTGASL
ncbi:MAG: amidohydrolase [Lachnospiraceae bacterium]|nr:amidohydrolase [Lachnospiraceae bacterium]